MIVSDGDRGEVRIQVSGAWRIAEGIPGQADVLRLVSGRPVSAVSFDGRGVTSWDSSLVTFAYGLTEQLQKLGVPVDLGGLPDGVKRLLTLARVRPETAGEKPSGKAPRPLAKVGDRALGLKGDLTFQLALLGDLTLSFRDLATGRSRSRLGDIVSEVKDAGARALPIITLTSFLLGMILAFVGAAALRTFGAGIYVADIVALAMVREMAAVATAIVMAGRTGSAYAARLATMNLTQELDALKTMGVGPIDFLVLPRVLALSLMQPLLCVYSSFVGICGGALVAVSMLDLTVVQYLNQTKTALSLTTFALGIGKGAVFGFLVAFLGCGAGLRTGRDAAAVGRAATMAMVSAIVAIIVADGGFAVIFEVLRI